MKKIIKVLVVDDSAFIRLLISDLLSNDDELEVIAMASNGDEAIRQTVKYMPDVVLLDMNMGEYSGIHAVRGIMKERPTPILILSSLGNSNLNPIFDALEDGAVDYINKPQRGGSKLREINSELITAVKRVARAAPKTPNIAVRELSSLPHTFNPKTLYDIIVIGASTGGPTAVEKVIKSLPANLAVPVIICQHMPANFIYSFAERLNEISPLEIVVGKEGMMPRPGRLIITPGESNSVLHSSGKKQTKWAYCDRTFKEYNNPSINCIMTSVAEHYGSKAIGVLLTGMGKDGVKGLQAIKDAGGKTISQDEASSVIYGMPKIAFETGAAEVQLHIKEIGGYLVNSL